MQKSKDRAMLLYELALKVGRSHNLYGLLKISLNSYVKKLECIAGMVFRIENLSGDEFMSEMIFSIPYALITSASYNKIVNLVPKTFSKTEYSSFQLQLPSKGKCDEDLFYHIFTLENFGCFVLIRKQTFLEDNLVDSLREINKQFAAACVASVKAEAIRESETRYRRQQELLPEMICETNVDGIVTYANPFALKKMGFSAAELQERIHLETLVHPDDRERIIKNFKIALRSKNPHSHEYRVISKNGITFPVLIYTNRLFKSGRINGLICIIVDIKRLKENEKKLESYTEQLELALLGSNAGLWDWNFISGEIFRSEKCCDLLGYNISGIGSDLESWIKIVHPEDAPGLTKMLNLHLANKRPFYQSEYRVRTKTGEWKWILDTGKVTKRDQTGKPLRAVGTQIDISERKHIDFLIKIEHELEIKLSRAKNLRETYKICLESSIEYSRMDCGGLYIADETDSGFRLVQHSGLSPEFVENTSYYAADSEEARILKNGNPIYTEYRKLGTDISPLQGEVLDAVAVIPIINLNKVIGCLNIASKTSKIIPDHSRIVLEKISAHLGAYIIQAKSEDMLRQNQQDLNTLFNTIDDFLFILDMEGRILYFNSTVTEKLGYDGSELINKNILVVHPHHLYSEAFVKIKNILRGTENVYRVPFMCKGGKEIPVETKVKKGTWNGKEVIIGISRDTSERRSYENQIKKNAERLEMALLASDSGLWDWNVRTDNLVLNKRWFSMRGLNDDKPFYKSNDWKTLLHPDDIVPTMKALNDHLENKTAFYQAEYRSITKSDQYVWILDTGKVMEYDDKGNPMRVVGTSIDITHKKANEIILQHNLWQQELLADIALGVNSPDDFNQKIKAILEKIGLSTGVSRVYIFEDLEGGLLTSNTFEWCNTNVRPQINKLQNIPYDSVPSWKKILLDKGYLYSYDISQLPDDLRAILTPQDIRSIIVYPLYVRSAFFGFIGFDECTRYKKWAKTELELLRTLSGIIANVYESRIMEQSIIDERDRANNANKAKSEFLANMSHEIRTPMNAILGFSEALYHKLDSVQHRKMVKSVLNSGNLLLSLLNDILDLSKIESGKLEIVHQPIDLKHILQEIKLLFNAKAQNKGIEMSINASDDFPQLLMLDEIRIKQVIFNLVGNAIKFTDKGFIKLNVSFKFHSSESGELQIEVEDTGIGIPESQFDLIFEAFRQQSGQSNRLYGGIGLGLAISRRLVEKMNGRITVKSKEGVGSVFRIVLPQVNVSNSEYKKKDDFNEIQDITFEKASILIIDDVASNIELVETLMSSTGLEIMSAETGEIALDILNRNIPDLILMDIRMPGLDGYEIARAIKRNPAISHIPIIAFTASILNSENIDNSENFDAVLMKPVNRSDLFTKLSEFLKHKITLSDNLPEQQEVLDFNSLPDNVKSNLTLIKEILETKMVPKFNSVKDQLVLFRIEEFAQELKTIATQYNFNYLNVYADKILRDLEIVDLDSLKETLSIFPRIMAEISSVHYGQGDK